MALAMLGAAGSDAATPGVAAIYVSYDADCTFLLSADGGITMTSSSAPGPTLPPGTYQVLITMNNPSNGYPCGKPVFTLTGPGVSLTFPFPGQAVNDQEMVTLQPSSTYVAADATNPAGTQKAFSTSAAGSPASLLGSSPGATGSASPTSTQPDLVGSGIAPFRGKLLADVSVAGVATLEFGGRSVSSLKPGRYDLAVDDATSRAGFFVRRPGGKPVAVTGVHFVGKRSEELVLTDGTWVYFARAGRLSRFRVG
jgi:hypothetical protein